MIIVDATKATCTVCGQKVKLRGGGADSDHYSCGCKTVIYWGWSLPKHWKLPWLYALKIKIAKWLIGDGS